MSHNTCPYKKLGKEAYWKKSVVDTDPENVSPFLKKDTFNLKKSDVVTTAGSCFAQHLARFLKMSGYNYLVEEEAPFFFPEELHNEYNYGTFSARYCNIYTTRQLVQLFDRAYGKFKPIENAWENGKYFQDPFRPLVQPNGFLSIEELEQDRKTHFRAVRNIFEKSDVFIFTLGLTEAWLDKRDGAAYPVAPGCGAGVFDKEKFTFHNLTVNEIIADLQEFLKKLKKVNTKVKVILTVSPVPLIATMSGGHVLKANTYSKAALRVAAEEISNEYDDVVYFPSYEIITSPGSRGSYYEDDLRSVKEEGVKHVMRVFFENFTSSVPEIFLNDTNEKKSGSKQVATLSDKIKAKEKSNKDSSSDMASAADVICEEEISLGNIEEKAS